MDDLKSKLHQVLIKLEDLAGITKEDIEIMSTEWPGWNELYHVTAGVYSKFTCSFNTEQTEHQAETSGIFSQECSGCIPGVITSDSTQKIVLYEDLSDYSSFEQLLGQSLVNTVAAAEFVKSLAKIHNATHKSKISEEQLLAWTQRYQSESDLVCNDLFVRPFLSEVLEQPSVTDRLKAALQNIQQNQRVLTAVQDVKQVYDQNRDTLIHAEATTSSILVKDSKIKILSSDRVHIGPASLDLGMLVAHYILWYHQHMLTPENNNAHRRVSYKLLNVATDAGRLYLQTRGLADKEAESAFMVEVAGFAGCELLRRATESESSFSASCRTESVSSASRLLNVKHRVHSMDFLLNVALSLTF